ncbi:tetratricopeptide repeat protein [Methylomonas sp. Kb3]|uniref:tetratricopeptide repeat protein n=1 Tax=Methylomonas sp. Kb3 TaxID=1611544 RepID=UPI001F0C872A|nr:tetratricopeptide repeat protein [Methylomonas sp. Kb3]
MKKWIAIAMFLSMSGCAVSPEKEPEAEGLPVKPEGLESRVNRNTVIDEEVLYLLMAAELAGQRNQYHLAMDAYLQAAKRVDDPRIAERAVKIGLFLKDEQRTREALTVWLSKDGKNLAARKFAVLLAIKNSDQKAAVENLNAMLADDPAGFEAGVLEMTKLMEKEGRTQFTYDVLEELAVEHPNQASVFFLQAVLASVLQNNELAQQKVNQALLIQPDWNKAVILQAQLAGRSGDLSKARASLEKALKAAPEDRMLRKMLLEVLVNGHDYDDAIKLCQSVLEDKPDDAETLFTLALVYMQQSQIDKAENVLEKLLNNPEWEGQASFYLGKIEVDQQHPDKALTWFDRVSDGNYAFDADMAAVSLLMNQKRFEEIEARIKRMDNKYPEQHLRVLMVKAELYNQLGKYQEAFDVLTLALKDMPDNREVLYARALVAERLDKLDVLESDLQKILEQKPDDVGALNALGYTLTDRTQRYEEAAKYLERALSLQPDEAVVIDSYGWLQFKLGKPERALEFLRRAYEKQPENEIAAHIAEVLWSLGEKKEAKELFDSVYKKSPDDEYLLEFKKRFLQNGQ